MERLTDLQRRLKKFIRARDWEQFHTPKNLAMALAVESAEIMEIFQWLTAKESAELTPDQRRRLEDELADTFIYLTELAGRFEIDLLNAAKRKIRKNARKYPVKKARGSAKKYSEL